MNTFLQLVLPFLIAINGPVLASYFGVRIMRGELLTKAKGARSQCDHCGHELRWYDLVPLFSYILRRGRCAYCHKPIKAEIFFAELIGLGLFMILGVYAYRVLADDQGLIPSLLLVGVHFVMTAFLLYLSIFDVFTFSIPTKVLEYAGYWAVGANLLALVARQVDLIALKGLGELSNLLLGLIAAFSFWLVVYYTKEKGLGMGDVFLAGLIGLMLGWPHTVSALYIMLFSALTVGLVYAIRVRRFSGLQVPLVPFMALAYVGALTFGPEIFSLLFISI